MQNRKRKQKQKTKQKKKSEKRMPQTLASLPWSLKTTRHDHQIDTNCDGRFHSKKDTPPNFLCLGRSDDPKRKKKGGVAFLGQIGLPQSIKV